LCRKTRSGMSLSAGLVTMLVRRLQRLGQRERVGQPADNRPASSHPRCARRCVRQWGCCRALFDTVVDSAFYHVFQDDEGCRRGTRKRCAELLGRGATVHVRIRNATTSTVFNAKACRPNAIAGGRRAPDAHGRSAGATAFNRITRDRRRGLNRGRMLLCHRWFDCRRVSMGRAVVLGAGPCSQIDRRRNQLGRNVMVAAAVWALHRPSEIALHGG
jgi:hypothetical protein